jgi:predicted anti-sigma-YlaC factor YlaD
MKCDAIQALIDEGVCSKPEHIEHLRNCSSCRAYRATVSILDEASTMRVTKPADFVNQTMAAWENEQEFGAVSFEFVWNEVKDWIRSMVDITIQTIRFSLRYTLTAVWSI